jgi:hypothetical protein
VLRLLADVVLQGSAWMGWGRVGGVGRRPAAAGWGARLPAAGGRRRGASAQRTS